MEYYPESILNYCIRYLIILVYEIFRCSTNSLQSVITLNTGCATMSVFINSQLEKPEISE